MFDQKKMCNVPEGFRPFCSCLFGRRGRTVHDRTEALLGPVSGLVTRKFADSPKAHPPCWRRSTRSSPIFYNIRLRTGRLDANTEPEQVGVPSKVLARAPLESVDESLGNPSPHHSIQGLSWTLLKEPPRNHPNGEFRNLEA